MFIRITGEVLETTNCVSRASGCSTALHVLHQSLRWPAVALFVYALVLRSCAQQQSYWQQLKSSCNVMVKGHRQKYCACEAVLNNNNFGNSSDPPAIIAINKLDVHATAA